MTALPIVTFDVFSALIDSRAGGSAHFGTLGAERGWTVAGREVYDAWDWTNKAAHASEQQWRTFAEIAADALGDAYRQLGLAGDARADTAPLLDSMAGWPLWPDSPEMVDAVRAVARIGLLSNIDDAVLARTRVCDLPVEPALAVTSEQLRAYKPAALFYDRARERLGRFVHVASSARDVRGSLEAGLGVVRLVRDGHRLEPAAPAPSREATTADELRAAVTAALW